MTDSDLEARPARARKADGKARKSRAVTDLLLKATTDVAAADSLDAQFQALLGLAQTAIHAERGSLFLFDQTTGELYTRVTDGALQKDIRIEIGTGIAGWVFTNGEAAIVNDTRSDPRFNREIDQSTGFETRSLLTVPVTTARGRVIGVAQLLNKTGGGFTKADQALLEQLTHYASATLESTVLIENVTKRQKQEGELLDVVNDVSSEIQLGPLLKKIIGTVTRMLGAERSTLFLNDDRTNELYTEVGEGLGATRIRFPNSVGIAGAVFTSGETINIRHAYADLRFNPSFDKQTGFFTRSILCVPVVNKTGAPIGVTQVLNKIGGTFTADDETRLKAFTAQISICLENARLFDDVQTIKNYNEAMLESMSNGVLTINEKGMIVTCNSAAQRILRKTPADVLGRPTADIFAAPNDWVLQALSRLGDGGAPDALVDAELHIDEEVVSVNATVLPLIDAKRGPMGSMLVLEDISSEKRVKATMSRYMDPMLADKLLTGGQDLLGGTASEATVLFSDIRSFTTLTEQLGAQGTVALLNEYFTLMVECIQREGGMLDKFIGDAIMAVFGTPFPHDDDEDRSVRAALGMLRDLDTFNRQRAQRGLMAIDMGIGINTDTIVSGNIGSPRRMDYTVIGDGVNLASRLESACKEYGARLLISDRTLSRLKGSYRTREVDLVIVKGKTEPVAVHEVFDERDPDAPPNMLEFLGFFKRGVQRYRGMDFTGALKDFSEARAANPQDKLARSYVGRCEALIAEPPEAGWNGVWTMKTK